jgi:hypothetical protein
MARQIRRWEVVFWGVAIVIFILASGVTIFTGALPPHCDDSTALRRPGMVPAETTGDRCGARSGFTRRGNDHDRS